MNLMATACDIRAQYVLHTAPFLSGIVFMSACVVLSCVRVSVFLGELSANGQHAFHCVIMSIHMFTSMAIRHLKGASSKTIWLLSSFMTFDIIWYGNVMCQAPNQTVFSIDFFPFLMSYFGVAFL